MGKNRNNSMQAQKHSRAQIDRNALLRFESACEYLVGPGYFEKFTPLCRERLLRTRANSVKMKIDASGFKNGVGKIYQDIFNEQLNKMTFTTIIGKEMPVSLYLREGLGLICYVEAMKNEPLHHIGELASAFRPYDLESELMALPVTNLVFMFTDLALL
jgi:hypothetical protein